jgi:hypothetical protein
MTAARTLVGLVVAGLVVSGCGARDTISGVRDVVSGVREITGDLQPAVPPEEAEQPEWTDFPEVSTLCGARWTRDEMIAAYEDQGLAGLPQRVGFSGDFANEIAEFHNRWRVTKVIEATRERRGVPGEPLEELITCVVGTVGPEDPREAFGVNVLYINDHVRPITRPTLRGIEMGLRIVTDGEQPGSEGEAGGELVSDAAVRWVGTCPRNVTLPIGGGYTQARCLLDGPGGLTSEHVDAPDSLPEDCPDPDLECAGLAYTPSRAVFTDILADPGVRYTFTSSWHSSWSYAD